MIDFLRCSKYDLKLGGGEIRVRTRNGVLCLFYCLFTICKQTKKTTLWIIWLSEDQMLCSLVDDNPEILFFELIICFSEKRNNNLFTFNKNAIRASIWVSHKKSRPGEYEYVVYPLILCLFTFCKQTMKCKQMSTR
jgi:hypothetical protein